MALTYKEAADLLRDGANNYHSENYIRAYGMTIDALEALHKLNVEIIVEKDSMGHYTNFVMNQSNDIAPSFEMPERYTNLHENPEFIKSVKKALIETFKELEEE